MNSETVSSQVKEATNSYLRSIIDDVVPSSTNYMANTNRYVNFFIYYYVNAHEYAVLSTLRNSIGNDLIKTILIERVSYKNVGGETVKTISEQTDLVIKSGDSKGTLPVSAELTVEIVESEG